MHRRSSVQNGAAVHRGAEVGRLDLDYIFNLTWDISASGEFCQENSKERMQLGRPGGTSWPRSEHGWRYNTAPRNHFNDSPSGNRYAEDRCSSEPRYGPEFKGVSTTGAQSSRSE
jgi:hypothetical protein